MWYLVTDALSHAWERDVVKPEWEAKLRRGERLSIGYSPM